MFNGMSDFIEKRGDTFDKHVVSKVDLDTGENDCIVTFRRPDTRNGYMIFTYVSGYLHINGDYGNASFTWHNSSNTFFDMARFSNSLGYFLEKCISYESESLKEFDQDACIASVIEYFEDHEKIIDDEEFDDWRDRTYDHHDWIEFVRNYGSEFFQDADYWEYAFDFGMSLKLRPYLWAYGLIKAAEALEMEIA